jgi:hypothetical protein
MTKNTAALTFDQFTGLQTGRLARVHVGRASIEVEWVPMKAIAGLSEGAMPKERRFVMRGPSGVHSLLVDATDMDRLNAHWVAFASHDANQMT